MPADDGGLSEKAWAIHTRLIDAYGEPQRDPEAKDAISEIVNTILSQNTNDLNRDRAYGELRRRFPTWQAVRHAPLDAVMEAIRPAGLAPQRAPRIKGALDHIFEQRGELSLDFLQQMPADEAKAWLMQINGVGPKTAAIILLFGFGMPAFPVDTHVHRVTRRLGLAPAKASAPKVQDIMEELMPPHTYYAFHVNLITHGRRICKAPRPLCPVCFLTDLCDYYAEHYAGGAAPPRTDV